MSLSLYILGYLLELIWQPIFESINRYFTILARQVKSHSWTAFAESSIFSGSVKSPRLWGVSPSLASSYYSFQCAQDAQ
jgi:hypothetical protein